MEKIISLTGLISFPYSQERSIMERYALRWQSAGRRKMQLIEIINNCTHLKVVERRCIKDDFIELVFCNEDMAEWKRILSSYLGQPRKPQGSPPSPNDLRITCGTGSIRINQTLFEQEFEAGTVIAKFWPWADGKHTTLRMALLLKG
jgi:hypothetical protein